MKHPVLAAAALAATVLAAAAGLVACESKTASAACASARDCLPSVAYTDTNHQTYAAKDLRGKVVVVNFWATWCGPCNKELPDLNRVYTRYKDKGVVMLGVLKDYQVDDMGLLNFMSDHELGYPVVRINPDIDSAYESPGELPTTFVYDREGKLAAKPHRGPYSEGELTALLDRLLQ